MADVYFEVAEAAIPKFGGKYFISHDADYTPIPGRNGLSYLQHSERAWMEQEGRVWFVKHRYETSPTVDLKEFMWIKLKAETICG